MAGVPTSATPVPTFATPAPSRIPAELARGDWTVPILAGMIFLAPAIGVPHEEMLQDTLKSVVVSMAALAAALLLFVSQRARTEPMRWHGIVWLPLMLMAYALGSMVWSHTYLAGVEAVRWFIFALLVWLGLNTLARERLGWLAIGVHGGAVVASLWAAIQFYVPWDLFPQGPNPASTFVNRNFFAEFVVCCLPFSMLLLARARQAPAAVLLAASTGLVIATILMTGTRAALIALWLQLLVAWPLILWRCRAQLPCAGWSTRMKLVVLGTLAGTVLLLGVIPSSNPKILEEERGVNALQRGLVRTQSIGPTDYSLNVRMVMWRATMTVIRAEPLVGLGAGAWESKIPLYQAEGAQLETDYYVHNEILQLIAEYGIVGWIFLALLFGYLLLAAWRSWATGPPALDDERPWRAMFLCSLLAFLVVSNIGFPWRMAATGALFALCLAGLAASDARLGEVGRLVVRPLPWSPRIANVALACTVVAIALALYITQQAAESERKIVRAAKLALTITASGQPHHPRWRETKQEMLKLAREGVALNPHYRKITPMVADELARWGDWANATWIWESVLTSRPYIVAIISNAARGYSSLGQDQKALELLERAKKIQPRAPAVRSLEVILMSRMGKEKEALALAKEALDRKIYDFDLVNALFILAWRAQDFPLAEHAMTVRNLEWPAQRAEGLMQLGNMYARAVHDRDKALASFRAGLAAAAPGQANALAGSVPPEYRQALNIVVSGTPSTGSQTSSTRR